MTRIEWLLKASPIIDLVMRSRQILEPSSSSSPSTESLPEHVDAQMAAYLATNPDPITGLPPNPSTRLPDRPLPERDRPDYREPYGDEPGPGDRILYDLYGWEW